MNSINANLPVLSMPQVTNLQSEIQRAPLLHQQQNADLIRDQLDLQSRIAREAEEAEGKNIDPDDKKEQERKGKKQEGEEAEGDDENSEMPPEVTVSMTETGFLIDLEA